MWPGPTSRLPQEDGGASASRVGSLSSLPDQEFDGISEPLARSLWAARCGVRKWHPPEASAAVRSFLSSLRFATGVETGQRVAMSCCPGSQFAVDGLLSVSLEGAVSLLQG
ncbi:hypothetical protein lerEdw1_003059 [Lerista edwardsae]|nr:hypothetical protein lerEdw1_003059 [Lerista edwardsae]